MRPLQPSEQYNDGSDARIGAAVQELLEECEQDLVNVVSLDDCSAALEVYPDGDEDDPRTLVFSGKRGIIWMHEPEGAEWRYEVSTSEELTGAVRDFLAEYDVGIERPITGPGTMSQ